MQRKKAYEKQRDILYAQQFNLNQAQFAQDSIRDAQITAKAMKEAGKQLKQEMKSVDIDAVDELQDDMADLMAQTEEIQVWLNATCCCGGSNGGSSSEVG